MIAALGLNGPAHAEERPSDTISAIEQAVQDAGQAPAAENAAVSLPTDGEDSATLAGENGTLEFDVPATGDITETSNTGVLLDGSGDDTSIAVESTDHGVRALIHIDSEDAPEHFEFPIGGDVTTLILNDDGSVLALNADDETIAIAATPWAVDRTGRKVPTHYQINGTTLTQIVKHRGGGFEYGITADPSFWWWVKQGASCLTGVITLGSLGYAKVSVGLAKLAVKMRAASASSKLGKAYAAWKKLGSSDSARFKTLVSQLKTLANMVIKHGFSGVAKHRKSSSKAAAAINFLKNGGAAVGGVFGVSACIKMVQEA